MAKHPLKKVPFGIRKGEHWHMKAFWRAFTMRTLALALLTTLLFMPQAYAAQTYRTLEFGSRGTEVLSLQKALEALGFDPSGTDGKFGRGTQNAVKAYQQARGLEADGKAGTQTLTKLYNELGSAGASGSASSASGLTRTLRRGYTGSDVTTVQTRLKELGYYTGALDGKYGSGSIAAVAAFQKRCGLKADGLVGQSTYAALFGGNAPAAGTSGSTTPAQGSTSGGLTRTLRRGYTGSDVTAVQTRLKELGYYTGALDGEYGSGSIAAVAAFQKRCGLKADGLVGQSTYAALFGGNAPAAGASGGASGSTGASGTFQKLRSGDTGTAVRTLQKALGDLGYNVTADGSYGPLTVAAVTAFQSLNGLTADGVAGTETQTVLYSGSAKRYQASSSGSTPSGGSSASSGNLGTGISPNGATIQLLHWFNEVKPALSNGQLLTAYDPATGISWTLRIMSRGNHADVEPLTAADTEAMFKAFGGKEDWGPKVVYIKLPDGRWSMASTHNVAHGSQTIKDNNFNGQNCVHFLRDMDECKKNDPNYGVQNQNAIRKAWKSLTGVTVE